MRIGALQGGSPSRVSRGRDYERRSGAKSDRAFRKLKVAGYLEDVDLDQTSVKRAKSFLWWHGIEDKVELSFTPTGLVVATWAGHDESIVLTFESVAHTRVEVRRKNFHWSGYPQAGPARALRANRNDRT